MVPKGTTRERGGVAAGLLGQRVAGGGWRRRGRGRRWGSSRRRTRRRRRRRPRWRRRRRGCGPAGCCTGLGQDQVGPKSTNSPWYSAWSVRPDGLHGGQVLAHHGVAAGPVDAVVLGLGAVPAEADAEGDPAPARDGRAWPPAWPAGSGRAARRGGCRCRARCVSSPRRPWPARPAGRGSACSRRGARRRRARAACPRARGGGCARAGRASRSRAPRPRRPARPAPGRGRSGRR